MINSNPYSFTDFRGRVVDWSSLVGQKFPGLSGHDNEITKDELARLCRVEGRANALSHALLAMREAGEVDEAERLFNQIIG
jgi:hypothetical protein